MNQFELKNRIKCERAIVERVIDDALAQGYAVTVNDGEEETLKMSRSKEEILAACFTTDEDYLLFHQKREDGEVFHEQRFGWVRFIYGNDGPDVVNDWVDNEEMQVLLKGAEELATRMEENGL